MDPNPIAPSDAPITTMALPPIGSAKLEEVVPPVQSNTFQMIPITCASSNAPITPLLIPTPEDVSFIAAVVTMPMIPVELVSVLLLAQPPTTEMPSPGGVSSHAQKARLLMIAPWIVLLLVPQVPMGINPLANASQHVPTQHTVTHRCPNVLPYALSVCMLTMIPIYVWLLWIVMGIQLVTLQPTNVSTSLIVLLILTIMLIWWVRCALPYAHRVCGETKAQKHAYQLVLGVLEPMFLGKIQQRGNVSLSAPSILFSTLITSLRPVCPLVLRLHLLNMTPMLTTQQENVWGYVPMISSVILLMQSVLLIVPPHLPSYSTMIIMVLAYRIVLNSTMQTPACRYVWLNVLQPLSTMPMIPPTTALILVLMVTSLMLAQGNVWKPVPKQPLNMVMSQPTNVLISAQWSLIFMDRI